MDKIKDEILEQFIRLQGLLHRYHTQHFMEFGPLGNSHRGQGRMLSILKLKPEISQKELTYLLDMSKQGLAELLNKLEKKGYIKREPVEEDRRSFNIKLTEEGAAVAGEIDVSSNVFKGEIFGMIGPNGVGKSTIFSMLTKLTKPSSGSIKVAGFDIGKQDDMIRPIIGIVPQKLSLYPLLTAKESKV
ncbi:MAG: ATP-binding cassette domain-containing protein [Methanosarcina barkeri]|nr:ATP-binding cassette domain-containing protein [Methanosarcina sp. ERenArc_MAG2]